MYYNKNIFCIAMKKDRESNTFSKYKEAKIYHTP